MAAENQAPADQPPSRSQAMLYGIVGQEMKQVTRRVPADEPPQLPVNAELRSIGQLDPPARRRAEGDRDGEIHFRRAAAGNAVRAAGRLPVGRTRR